MNGLAGSRRLVRFTLAAALCLVASSLPGATIEKKKSTAEIKTARDEIKAFCANIADAARDQRYLLQKEELTKLQADVNERIALLERRKSEYEDWLKKREDFLKSADAGLIAIYKTMKPDAAASQLELVSPYVAAAILMKLAPNKSALILTEMKKEKAAELASIISSAVARNTQKGKT